MTIYIEIINNTPVRATNSIKVVQQLEFQNIITTEYEDYDINSIKYLYQDGEVILNPNYEEEEYKCKRRQEIYTRLEEIDRICIRALRANETDRIQNYETECIALREELKEL